MYLIKKHLLKRDIRKCNRVIDKEKLSISTLMPLDTHIIVIYFDTSYVYYKYSKNSKKMWEQYDSPRPR
jgi:carbamate kinase